MVRGLTQEAGPYASGSTMLMQESLTMECGGTMEQLWKHCATACGASLAFHFALVSEPIHRANHFRLRTDSTNFLPEVFDMTIHGTVAHHTEISIEGIDQLAAREHPPGMGEEGAQQAELDWRQLERTAVEDSTVPLFIQDEPPRGGRTGRLGPESTQHSFD